MNSELILDTNQYPGAVMYAKLHNISFKQLVENFLMKFQTSTKEVNGFEIEEYLGELDESLMKQTFEAVHHDYLAGRCVPNSEVVDYIKNELGWK